MSVYNLTSVISWLGALLITVVALPSLAQATAAPTEEACIASFDSGQKDRMASRLMSARGAFQICSNQSCPDVVRAKCFEWFEELQGEIPTVVFGAKGRDGKDLLNVKVTVDGTIVAESLDGSAMPFNPGAHTFIAVAEGYAPVETPAILKVGEQNRAITFTLGSPGTPGPSDPKPAGGTGGDGADTGGGGTMPLAIAGFSVAGVGAIIGGIFGGLSLSKAGDVKDKCTTVVNTCFGEDIQTLDDSRTFAHVSTIAFVVAGVGAGVGIIGLVLDDSGDSNAALYVGPSELTFRMRF